jgi:hypothetical protein
MRRIPIALAMILASAGFARAADFSTAFGENDGAGLHAGSIGSLYLGYLGYDPDNVDIDAPDQGIVGGRFAYAHPLTETFSAQFDLLGEVNFTGSPDDDNDLTLGDYMAAVHIDSRDPSSYLLGAFGGGGQSFDNGDNGDPIPYWFAGAEAQIYHGNGTLGAQIGYLDSDDNYLESIYDAVFARLAASVYFGERTKLTGELSYLHGSRPNVIADSGGIVDIAGWGMQFDHQIADSPFHLMLAYDGFDFNTTEESDAPWVHEARIGVTVLFGSSDLMDNDRRAAGADLPPINRWISTSANEIE